MHHSTTTILTLDFKNPFSLRAALPKKCDNLKLICVAAGNLSSSFEHYLHCKFRLSHLLHAIISTTGQEETSGGLHFGPSQNSVPVPPIEFRFRFVGWEMSFGLEHDPPYHPIIPFMPPPLRQSSGSQSAV